MRCDYCFYNDEAAKRRQASFGFMSEQTLHNVIRRTLPRAEGMASFAFQGGEPTLRGMDFFRRAIEYEQRCNLNRVHIQNALQTNGTLLDEKWSQFLHDNGFLVGLSVDGLPDIHDRYRHLKTAEGSSWERVCRAAELLDRFEVDYNILTVVHADVAGRIEEIYRAYQERGWRFQQYIPCLEPLEEERGTRPWSLAPELYGEFLIRLFELWYTDALRGTQPYIRQFENYIGMLLGYPPEACDQQGCCGIQYAVEADGSVYPCDFYMLDADRLGNFNTDRIEMIDKKRREIGFIEKSRRLDGACLSCPWYALCRGGCQRNREPMPNQAGYRNVFCESYRRFFEVCLPKMRELIRLRIES